jgi:RNA polymerase sigma factor (sigma-70 family)
VSVSQTIQTLLRHLHGTADPAGTDAELVERFVRGDDAAFAVLVGRHGPMVLGVCRRILQNPQDAEDAFQATFVILARKAATLGRGAPVGAWLYGVAYRTAAHARSDRARRSAHERRATAMPAAEQTPAVLWDDLRPVLDEELQRLPEKYRVPVVLCYLDGKTYDEAAEEIGCPKGTLATRLARAREILRERMSGRGVSLPAAVLAALVAENARAAVPAPLSCAAVEAATASAPACISTLAAEVLKAMSVSKLKAVTTLLVAAALLGAGAAALAYHATGASPETATPAPPVAAPAADPPAPEKVKPVAAEEFPWGAPDKGVQIRLRPLQIKWKAGDTPTFHIDLRNQGEKAVGLIEPSTASTPYWEVEFDGTWYGRKLEKASVQHAETPLKAGAEAKAWVDLGLHPLWLKGVTGADRYTSDQKGEDLPLTPGKHKVRVAYNRPGFGEVRPVSNVVEIEILKADEKEKPGQVQKGVAPVPAVDIRARDGAVLVAAEQIRSYDWETHTLTLAPKVREELVATLLKTRQLVQGVPFEVAVGGKAVYEGKFTTTNSSLTIAAPVIVVDLALDATLGADQLRVQLGYPGAGLFKGEDPRGDERLRDALKATGKLAKAADDKKPTQPDSPAEHLKQLRKQHEAIEATFRQESRAAQTNEAKSLANKKYREARQAWGKEALAAVRKSADLPEAFEVIVAILQHSGADTAEMVELMRKHHAARPDLGKLFHDMLQESGDEGRKFVEEMAEKSPVATVRGQAALALGWQAKWRITQDGEERFGFGTKLTEDERQRMEARSEKYLTMALKYTEAPLTYGKGTVASSARAELAGLKNLSDLRVGKVCPDIAGEAVDGTKFKLSDSRGKVTVVVFWATWCAPCMRMVPHEKKLVERLKDKPFALVGINGDDDREKASAAAKKAGMSWPSFWDAAERPEGPITKAWNVHAWPTVYVLDAKGVIRWIGRDDTKLDELVDELIAEIEKK